MTDKELQRAILTVAYENRYEEFVDLSEKSLLGDVDLEQLYYNVNYLDKKSLINMIDTVGKLFSITPLGIDIVEDKERFNKLFPFSSHIPEETKQLVRNVETLLRGKYDSVLAQLSKAKQFLYDNSPPDPLNSAKESVGAVEALAKILLKKPSRTLGDLAKSLNKDYLAHPAMEKIIHGIYGVASDVPGARHGAHRKSDFDISDAEFIFNVCIAIIIYLAENRKS